MGKIVPGAMENGYESKWLLSVYSNYRIETERYA